jgi:AbrB family looped-hinge helix DNA binding protein
MLQLRTVTVIIKPYLVRIAISSNGRLVIPKPIRERRKICPADEFLLFELSHGDLLLRSARSTTHGEHTRPRVWSATPRR